MMLKLTSNWIPAWESTIKKWTHGLPYVYFYTGQTVSYYNSSTQTEKMKKIVSKVLKETKYVNVVVFKMIIEKVRIIL